MVGESGTHARDLQPGEIPQAAEHLRSVMRLELETRVQLSDSCRELIANMDMVIPSRGPARAMNASVSSSKKQTVTIVTSSLCVNILILSKSGKGQSGQRHQNN